MFYMHIDKAVPGKGKQRQLNSLNQPIIHNYLVLVVHVPSSNAFFLQLLFLFSFFYYSQCPIGASWGAIALTWLLPFTNSLFWPQASVLPLVSSGCFTQELPVGTRILLIDDYDN